MPLNYTKLFALIALLTIAAFIAWLVVGSLFEGEVAESEASGLGPQISVPAHPAAHV